MASEWRYSLARTGVASSLSIAPRQYLAFDPERSTTMAATGTPFDRATQMPQSLPKWRETAASIRGGVARIVRHLVRATGSCCLAAPRWVDLSYSSENTCTACPDVATSTSRPVRSALRPAVRE